MGDPAPINGLVFKLFQEASPSDSTIISVSPCSRYRCVCTGTNAMIIDTQNEKRSLVLSSSDEDGTIRGISWVKNDNLDDYTDPSVITIHENGVITLWDLSNCLPRQRFPHRTIKFTAMTSFVDEEDEQLFYITGSDGSVRGFSYDKEDRELNEKRTKIQKASNKLTSIAPLSSSHLAYGTENGRIIVSDINRGELDSVSINEDRVITHIVCTQITGETSHRTMIIGDDSGGINMLRLGPDNSVVFDQQIAIGGSKEKSGLRGACTGLWFSSNLQILVISSEDGTVRCYQSSPVGDDGSVTWSLVGTPIVPFDSPVTSISGFDNGEAASIYMMNKNVKIMTIDISKIGFNRGTRPDSIENSLLAQIRDTRSGCAEIAANERIAFSADSTGFNITNFPLIRPQMENEEETVPKQSNVKFLDPDVASLIMFELESATTIPEAVARAEFSAHSIMPPVCRSYPNAHGHHQIDGITSTADGTKVSVFSRHGGIKVIGVNFDSNRPCNVSKRLSDVSFSQLSQQLEACVIYDAKFIRHNELQSHPILIATVMYPSQTRSTTAEGEYQLPNRSYGVALIEEFSYGVWGISNFVQTATPLDRISYSTNSDKSLFSINIAGVHHAAGWMLPSGKENKQRIELFTAKLNKSREHVSAIDGVMRMIISDASSSPFTPLASAWSRNRKCLICIDCYGSAKKIVISGDHWKFDGKFSKIERPTEPFNYACIIPNEQGNAYRIAALKYDGSMMTSTIINEIQSEYIKVTGDNQSQIMSMSSLDSACYKTWAEILSGSDYLLKNDDSIIDSVSPFTHIISFARRDQSETPAQSSIGSKLGEDRFTTSNVLKKRTGRTLSMSDFFKRSKASLAQRKRFGQA